MSKVVPWNLKDKDPQLVKKILHSNRAHERCLKSKKMNARKYDYHIKVISMQNREARVLSKSERKNVWNDLSVAPW